MTRKRLVSMVVLTFFATLYLAAQASKVEHLTKQQFISKVFDYEKNKEWVYNGTQPAILEFYAPWCGPCKMMAPMLDELSNTYHGKVKIYKVNVDVEKELAAAFGVQSIPYFLLIPKNGAPADARGALQKQALVDYIEKTLLK